jgi:hypothetical protein
MVGSETRAERGQAQQLLRCVARYARHAVEIGGFVDNLLVEALLATTANGKHPG